MPDEDDYEYRVRYKRKLRFRADGPLTTITGYNGPMYSLEDAVQIKNMYKAGKGGLVEFFNVGVERRLIMPWEKVRT